MSTLAPAPSVASVDRSLCQGHPPLTARLQPWMQEVLADPSSLPRADGAPVHLHCVEPMQRRADELVQTAADRGLQLEVFFARKANKALAYVDAMAKRGHGVDTASDVELDQTLRHLPPERVISTAAVKPRGLLEQAAATGVVVALDNADELTAFASCGGDRKRAMLRVSGFEHAGQKLPSRFGVDIDEAAALVADRWPAGIELAGLHFHLDGYRADQRASAIQACAPLAGHLRSQGHTCRFLDIGGGFPMSYLDDVAEWHTFQVAVAERPREITWDGTSYRHGERWTTYPYFQSPVQTDWLAGLLDEVAQPVRAAGLTLRCEPGRSLLDGCGLTVAEVAFRKQLAHWGVTEGAWAIGLMMNRTQCRTTSEDFLVDPLLLRTGATPGEPCEGFLVGAYCMESEALTKRRLHFPHGVAVGDRVVFPNTAGYLMHFLESRSHQFPLPPNFVWHDGTWHRDTIDAG